MRDVEEVEEEGADDRRSPPNWRVTRDVDAEAVGATMFASVWEGCRYEMVVSVVVVSVDVEMRLSSRTTFLASCRRITNVFPSGHIDRSTSRSTPDPIFVEYVTSIHYSQYESRSGAENTVSAKTHVTILVYRVMRNLQYGRSEIPNSESRHGSSPATRPQKRRPSSPTLGRRESAKPSSASRHLQQQ